MSAVIPIRSAKKFEVTCSSCNLRELCLPGGVCLEDLQRVEHIVYARRRVKRGRIARPGPGPVRGTGRSGRGAARAAR